jgi:hypothetical protein
MFLIQNYMIDFRVVLLALLTLNLLLSSCIMNTSVNSGDNTLSNASSPLSASAQPIEIEGEIISIMETCPLQLTVATSTERYHVSLLPETIVRQVSQPIDAGALRTHQTVQISGYSTENQTITAELIELQAE